MTDSGPQAIPSEIRVIVDPAQGVDETSLREVLERQAQQLSGLEWWTERLFPDSDDQALLVRADSSGLGAEEVAAIGLRLRRELSAREDVSQAAIDLPVNAFDPAEVGAFTGTHDRPAETDDPDWSHRLLRVQDAWAYSRAAGRSSRGSGILVGHPDTGYTDHPAMTTAVARELGYDTVDEDTDARDPLEPGFGLNPGHGTGTGSKIAGGRGDGATTLGVAPEARILPLRAIRGVVQLFDSDVARAVDYARRHNVHVISMSLGGKGFFGLKRAIQRAVDAGIIVCAAAGNNVSFVVAPASYANTIAVGGTDFADGPWEGSSHGKQVDVSAPAEAVHVAAFDWDAPNGPTFVTNRGDGTSFAVAQVAGAAALWLAHHGRAQLVERYGASQLVEAFRFLLQDAAVRRPSGWDDDYGSGVIDTLALLEAPLPDPTDLAGIGAFAVPDTAAERIASVLGTIDADSVIERATQLSGFANRATVLSWLARNEDELIYLLMTNQDVHDLFTNRAQNLREARPAIPAATDGVRSVLGAPEATYVSVAAGSSIGAFGLDQMQPGVENVRPFDRRHVDLSVLDGAELQMNVEAVVAAVGPYGSDWEPSSKSGGGTVSGRVDFATAGAFGMPDVLDTVAGALLFAAAPTVDMVRVISQTLGTRRQEVRHLTLRGHEIVGSDMRLTLGREAGVHISGRLLDITEEMDPGPPPPTRTDEINLACRDQLGLPATNVLIHELVIFPTAEELIWAYKLKTLVEDPLADLRIYLRADDLSLLLCHDIVLAHPDADVYASNPSRNSQPERVTLADLPNGSTILSGSTFDVLQRKGGRFTQAAGNFVAPIANPEFDEPNVYHHLTRALQWFVAVLGKDPFSDNGYRPIRALVRDPRSRGPRAQYVPSDRSLRFDDRPLTAARSADMIYHEFTHAITDAECRLYRSPSIAAKGIAEGIADYVASTILDDPRFGDYVMENPAGARNCNDPSRSLRFSAADANSEHAIGAVWAAMLWELRDQLTAEVTDALVVRSLHNLVPGSSLAAGIDALIAADGEHHDVVGPGPNAATIRAAYELRA